MGEQRIGSNIKGYSAGRPERWNIKQDSSGCSIGSEAAGIDLCRTDKVYDRAEVP